MILSVTNRKISIYYLIIINITKLITINPNSLIIPITY